MKGVYITIFVVIVLLSSCFVDDRINRNRVERKLFGEDAGFVVIDRSADPGNFIPTEFEYYFHSAMTGPGKDVRPGFLSLMDEQAILEYIVWAFRSEEVFSDTSLHLNGEFYLYRGDIVVPGSPCASYPCAVYWLEDRTNSAVFVHVFSF